MFGSFAHSSRRRLGKRYRAGFSLVEVIFSTLIVGVMLIAALETAGAVFRTERQNADRLTGPNLALELMTEVLAMAYEELMPDTVIADIDADESLNSDFPGWSWGVTVVDASTGDPPDDDTDLKLITVKVTSPTGEETDLAAYRAKDGMLERPEVEMTAVTWLGAKLQLGVNNDAATVGTNLTNFATEAE